MKTCILGYGFVGSATAKALGIQRYYTRSKSNITLEEVAKCDLIFVALPTPVDTWGKYYVDDIKELVVKIEEYGSKAIYVIRSTVYPGFADRLKEIINRDEVVSNPEFLSEDTADHDAANPPFVLLGGGKCVNTVKQWYKMWMPRPPYIVTDNRSAEMAKLAMNAYFATKVIFANQLYDACENLDCNYEDVKKVLEGHPFGPDNHFTIWYKGKRGVHGHCLPKDSRAYADYASSELVAEVVHLNKLYKDLHVKKDET